MIALDGADGRTLDRASRDGTLPHLAAMRARGHAWKLSAPRDVTDDALWASFQYGMSTGEHGRYAAQIHTVAAQPRLAIAQEDGMEAFWETLSRRNRRVAILDVPKVAEPRAVNGIHLADWLVHGRYFRPRARAYPEVLCDEVLTRFG